MTAAKIRKTGEGNLITDKKKPVLLLMGAGQIGLAIVRRVAQDMKVVVGDKRFENAQTVTKVLTDAGFDAVATVADLASRESIRAFIALGETFGDITMLVNAAGVSPSQASIETILKVDLYGTAVLLEEVVDFLLALTWIFHRAVEVRKIAPISHRGLAFFRAIEQRG